MLDAILFNAHDVVLLITVYQCAVLALIFSRSQLGNPASNRLLIGFLLATAAISLDVLINFGAGFHPWMVQNHPNWFYVFEAGYWLQGPLLLWFFRSVIYKNFKLGWWDYAHIIPLVLYFTHQLISYHLLSAESKILIQQSAEPAHEGQFIGYIIISRECLRAFFGVSCFLEYRRYRRALKLGLDEGAERLVLLRTLAVGFASLWCISFFVVANYFLSQIFGYVLVLDSVGLIGNYATCLLLSALAVHFKLNGFSKNTVEPEEKCAVALFDANRHPPNPEHIKALEQLMLDKKPYLQSGLTLDSLAHTLKLSSRTLSNIINRHYGYNFFEFVNHYRVGEAKQMLASPKHHDTTVLDIMYSCGFNSKAAFNTSFKRIEGTTPREFKKRQQQMALREYGTKLVSVK